MDKVTFAILNSKIKNITENVDQIATQATEDWLEDNVDPTTGYVLDRTLSMSNAAAPADLVGEQSEKIEDNEKTFNDYHNIIKFATHNGTGKSGVTVNQHGNFVTLNGIYTASTRRRFNLSGNLENTASATPSSWYDTTFATLKQGKIYRLTTVTDETEQLEREASSSVYPVQPCGKVLKAKVIR